MKKQLLLCLMCFSLVVAFSQEGPTPVLISAAGNATPTLYDSAVMTQEQLREQLQTAVQTMNQTQIRINQTTIEVMNGQVSVVATQEQNTNRIQVSNTGVSVEGVSITDEATTSPVRVSVRVQTATGEHAINVVREQNQVRIEQEGLGVNVSVSLTNQLMFQDNKMYMNITGVSKEVSIDPLQAITTAQVRNQTRAMIELYSESETPKYRIMEEKTVRLLGLIPVDISVETRINAETGNVENINKPWWSILTIE